MTSINLTEFKKFVANNGEFLSQRYRDHFGSDRNITRTSINNQDVVDYICEIFQFRKSQDDLGIDEKIRKSLTSNIQQFFEIAQEENFNEEYALRMLEFCIQSNDMFAVSYDFNKRDEDEYNQVEENNKDPRLELGKSKNIQGSKREKIPQTNSPTEEGYHTNQIQKINQIYQTNLEDSNRPEIKDSLLRQNSMLIGDDNQFDVHQEKPEANKINEKIIKKNAKIIFDFYSKQQMSIGVNNTFDRLGYEVEMLSLGAFMVIAKELRIINLQLSKDVLIKKFKKIAEGKSQIDFPTFFLLLSQLQVIDPTLYFRIQFEKLISKANLKAIRSAFNTQDQSYKKQVKQMSPLRYQNKLSKSTNLQNQSRSASCDELMLKSKPKYEENKIFSLKDLEIELSKNKGSVDFGILENLLEEQKSKDPWLKDDYSFDRPRKVKRLCNFDVSISHSNTPSRQEKLIEDMKKRISQIQNKQKAGKHPRDQSRRIVEDNIRKVLRHQIK